MDSKASDSDSASSSQRIAAIDAHPTSYGVTVLPEDTYVSALERIIQRDFFPDLPKLRAQVEYVEAMERGDLEKMRSVAIKYRQGHMVEPGQRAGQSTAVTPGLIPRLATAAIPPSLTNGDTQSSDSIDIDDVTGKSLDEFQRQFDSQDNASFADLVSAENARKREKYAWLHNPVDGTLRLADSSTDKKSLGMESRLFLEDGRKELDNHISTWRYKPKNTLMYYPDGFARRNYYQNPSTLIAHNQTRITGSVIAGGQEQKQGTVSDSLTKWRMLDQGPGEAMQRLANARQCKYILCNY